MKITIHKAIFMLEHFNYTVIKVTRQSNYKYLYNVCIKEINKGRHKYIFKHKINEELIAKSCSQKKMYNWNEYACEEYAKECEKYSSKIL